MQNNYLRKEPAIEAGGVSKILQVHISPCRNHDQANLLESQNIKPFLHHWSAIQRKQRAFSNTKPCDECPAVRLDDVVEAHICCRLNQEQQQILKAALKERESCSYE